MIPLLIILAGQVAEPIEQATLSQSQFNTLLLSIIASLIALLGAIGGFAVHRLANAVDGMRADISGLRVDMSKTEGRVEAMLPQSGRRKRNP